MNLWLLMSSFESDLVALESFREWLHELVEAQHPLQSGACPSPSCPFAIRQRNPSA